jgi:hypothetical protein
VTLLPAQAIDIYPFAFSYNLSRGTKIVKQKTKRVYQNKMWDVARFYCKEAQKCYKARAYFSAIVARGCELEALLRIFDFVEVTFPPGYVLSEPPPPGGP